MHMFLVHHSKNKREGDLSNKLQYGSDYSREIRARVAGPNKQGLVVM